MLVDIQQKDMIKKSYSLLLTLALLLVLATAAPSNITDRLWPKPATFSSESDGPAVKVNPCDIKYIIESPGQVQVRDILDYYLVQVFKCTKGSQPKITMNIIVKDTYTLVPLVLAHQKYELYLRANSKWQLNAYYYPGFLRGLQTFSQLFDIQDKEYSISGLPISIIDSPQFLWRGLMIDTSRHFLPLQTIKHAIDGMLFNKLNVLHWHITDEDSFPYEIPNMPDLSVYGKVGGVYSVNDFKTIMNYARVRGIRVVPEIDTPAHTESWGRSLKYKDITINCNGEYEGQFDPTLNKTWEVVTQVMNHTEQLFDDNYVHFGGDEVEYDCWNKRPSIKEWMKQRNIPTYKDLTIWYRQQQKKVWRNLTANKKVIYWANEEIDLPLEKDDVIQWWGVSSNVGKMKGRPNQVILSNYDLTYLDIGFGNRYGNHYGVYQNWRTMYKFNPRVEGVNVIGGETCMWSQIANQYVFDQKVVQRSGLLGERLWNDQININVDLLNIAKRLNAHSQRLRARGFKVWPVTVGLCEKNMEICF